MEVPMEAVQEDFQQLTVHHDTVRLRSEEPTQFIDLTESVVSAARLSGVAYGFVAIQVLHTTAAIVINENEPLLLDDLKAMLERLAPSDAVYAHDDPHRRRVNRLPEERANGRAHARALLLGTSQVVNIVEGRLVLGRWQSVMLVELDGPRERTISITVMGFRKYRA